MFHTPSASRRFILVAPLLVVAPYALSFHWFGQIGWRDYRLQLYLGVARATNYLDSFGASLRCSSGWPQANGAWIREPGWRYLGTRGELWYPEITVRPDGHVNVRVPLWIPFIGLSAFAMIVFARARAGRVDGDGQPRAANRRECAGRGGRRVGL